VSSVDIPLDACRFHTFRATNIRRAFAAPRSTKFKDQAMVSEPRHQLNAEYCREKGKVRLFGVLTGARLNLKRFPSFEANIAKASRNGEDIECDRGNKHQRRVIIKDFSPGCALFLAATPAGWANGS